MAQDMTGDPRIPREGAALPACTASKAPAATGADKAALRAALLAARRALDPALKARWDAQIGAHVLAWWRARRCAAVGVYWPLRGEPDLSPAYAQLVQAGARLALPVVVARDAPLAFADWVPGEAMARDQLGAAVPASLRLVAPPPALLIPCLGFNAERYRLGYGGGFYDRTLAATPRPHTVGIAYACLAAEFASAPHDVALDLIVTEAA
jgi:5-formyltetrahydrofolate cyclo-ligase